MTVAQGTASRSGVASAGAAQSRPLPPEATSAIAQEAAGSAGDVIRPDSLRPREKFIPVTRFAVIDRLTEAHAWPPGEAAKARRFFRYLDYWRHQQYTAEILELEQAYEPFSPDSDLLMTRKFTDEERRVLQKRVVARVKRILEQANYVPVDPAQVELILTKETHYGLDLTVDFGAFEELLIYYRGASNKRDQRRTLRKFLRKEEFDVPIFQRLFLLFKPKPMEARVREIMAQQKVDRVEAERIVQKLRAHLPGEVKDDNIYMKLFRNIPRSDVEMIFPNTRVKFRLLDKLKLGVTAGGGLGMGAVGAAGKLALVATNPIAAAGAVFGLGTIAFRQAMNFMNQKQRYMVVMAQNLYFHSMADNRGVIMKLADRAAEEDVKEEMLLYAVLAKTQARHSELMAIDTAIEKYIFNCFGVHVNFDLEDALHRLKADGLVREDADGRLYALPPQEACAHIDRMWDSFLDHLPDPRQGEGREFEGLPAGSRT